MECLPEELQGAFAELSRDYEEFQNHDVGANGYLLFAKNRISSAPVAIKFYYGPPGDRRHDEPRLLASIRSPNVLRIIDARNISDEWAVFVTPKCEDGDLDSYISGRPSVFEAIDVAIGICTGTSAIHANGLIHRDLKPGNIVCDRGIPLIADFGSVRKLAEGGTDVPASGHSVLYRPPESFGTRRYSIQGDVYQIGLVSYQLLGGSLPYDAFAYFSRSDHRQYATLTDDFEKSQFEDSVIARQATNQSLIDLSTLPPWVGGAAKAALRKMTHPDLNSRFANVGEIAAALSRVRAKTSNWRTVENVARLERVDRVIELRPIGNGIYEPLQSKGDSFRRIPNLPNGSLKSLVERIG